MKDCSERLQYQKRKRKKEVMIQSKGLLPLESSDISEFFLSYFSSTTGTTKQSPGSPTALIDPFSIPNSKQGSHSEYLVESNTLCRCRKEPQKLSL